MSSSRILGRDHQRVSSSSASLPPQTRPTRPLTLYKHLSSTHFAHFTQHPNSLSCDSQSSGLLRCETAWVWSASAARNQDRNE